MGLDQILPSLRSIGDWSYWIIGVAAMLEAFFATGIFVPGTLIVDAGGMLVQQGTIDFFDLVWFVAIGSVIGGEISYWVGVLARRGLDRRWDPTQSKSYQKAERLFSRYGGMALVLGRFAGPVSGLVPFAAAVAGIERRRFVIWNVVSGFPYALAHVALGYFLGDVITRIGPIVTRVALFAGAVLVLLVVLWWLIVRVERALPFVWSILTDVGRAVAENPGVKAWAARRPRLAGFIGHRFDTERVSGLTATLLGLAIAYVIAVWIASVLDLVRAEPIVQVDARLANLIHAFWTPFLLRSFAHLTALGDWRVIGSLGLAVLAWLWSRRRPDLMLGLCLSVVGDVATVAILKRIFDRPRPELAYFVETSGSFPSGHAAISVAFWAMLFVIAWRLGRIGPIFAGLFGATLAFIIGLSRLFLIEHYLTDVLNGWVVGALWLLIGIAAAEWWRAYRPAPRPVTRRGVLNLVRGVAVLLAAVAVWQVASYDKARNIHIVAPPDRTVSGVAAVFAPGSSAGGAPVDVETIVGTPLQPLNVVLLARDEAAVTAAMKKAGWVKTRKPSFSALAAAAWSVATGSGNATGPVTPFFWRGEPSQIAFEKPAPGQTGPARHHLRLWRSNFVTRDGLRLFVGAASLDDGLDWRLVHRIAPKIDPERDAVAADLGKAGVVSARELLAMPDARGGGWVTDGKAAVLTLK